MELIDPEWFTAAWEQKHYSLRDWLEFDINEADPLESKLRCRICNKAVSIDKTVKVKPQHAAKLQEWFAFSKLNPEKRNRRHFLNHLIKSHVFGVHGDKTKTVHQTVLETLKEAEKSKMKKNEGQLVREVTTKTSGGIFEATCNVFSIVYAAVQINVPFFRIPDLIVLADAQLGGKVGKLHRTRQSATKITHSISTLMHRRLVQHICSADVETPFSLILDGSTDKKGDHYLITYFQALEPLSGLDKKSQVNNPNVQILTDAPVAYEKSFVYFYKLIPLKGESAAEQMATLKSSFEKDDEICAFSAAIKQRAIGFGSDGASVNLGSNNGLIVKMREYVGRTNVWAVHCMAHRLQLTIGYAWKSNSAPRSIKNSMNYMEKLTNGIYSFFHSAKRAGILTEATKAFEEYFYVLNYIFEVRWVASEFEAVRKIFDMFSSIIASLERIAGAEDEFDNDAKVRAKGYLKQMQNRNYIAFAAFAVDVLGEFSVQSKTLQQKANTLIGQKQQFNKFRKRIEKLKTPEGYGDRLSELLTKAKCETRDDVMESCKTLETYEQSVKVDFKQTTMLSQTESSSRFAKLSSMQSDLVDALLNGIDRYFPESETDALSALDPATLPVDPDEGRGFKVQMIAQLANFFKLPSSETTGEWQNLLEILLSKKEIMKYKNAGPNIFWGFALAAQEVEWGKFKNIRQIIRSALVLPSGSVEAERGFSIMKHTKYDRRTRLGGELLDAILRLRVNGPDIHSFQPLPYVAKWHKDKNALSDSASGQTVTLTEYQRRMLQEVSDIEEKSVEKFARINPSNLF